MNSRTCVEILTFPATLVERMLFTPPRARRLCATTVLPCAFAFISIPCTLGASEPARVQPGTLPLDEKTVREGVSQVLKPTNPEATPDFPLATPVEAVTGTAAPLSVRGKADYFLKSTFSPQTLGRVALTTGFNQMMSDSTWGSGMDGYSDHLQARYFEHVTRRGVQFAVGAMRGEDPRFYRSGRTGFWDRTKFVLSRTVMTQMDNGTTSLAVGRLAGFAVGNYASSYWRPDNPAAWKHTLSNTGVNLSTDVGLRMLREFWPDIKRKFKP